MQRQHKLERFWRSCFERPNSVEGNVLSNQFNAAADIEAVLWLHYGVEAGFFSKSEAESVLQRNRERVLPSLNVGASTVFSPRLSKWLPNVARVESVLDIEYADRLAPDLLNATVLEMLFNEMGRISTNSVALLFSDSITFATDSAWRELMAQNVNPDRILAGTGTKIDLVCAGYFATLDHMAALDELLQYCADEFGGAGPTLRDAQGEQTYRVIGDRVRLIHLWRLKLDDRAVRDRFLSLTYMLQKRFDTDPELKSMGCDSDGFLRIVDLLSKGWLGDYGFSMLTKFAA